MKKVIIAVCLMGIVVVGILMFIFSNNQPAINPEDKKVFGGESTKTYDSGLFSFSYPNSAILSSETKTEDGQSLLITPPNPGNTRALVEVSVKSAQEYSAKRQGEIMKSYRLQPSNVTVGKDKIPAILYSGELEFSPTSAVQQKAVLFEKDGYTYKIGLTYASVEEKPEFETFFQDTLSSFNPN